MKEKIKDMYDRCAGDYNKHMLDTKHYEAQSRILKKLKTHINKPILDVACGPGFMLTELHKEFSSVFGNDFSEEMIKIAKQNNPEIAITNEDAEILESYNNKFGTIISSYLMFYLQDHDKALKKWQELLKEDGTLIIIDEYPFQYPKNSGFGEHSDILAEVIRPLSPEEIIKLAENNGFILKTKEKTEIDAKHSLYGMAFSKR